jgi:hypothetical protein
MENYYCEEFTIKINVFKIQSLKPSRRKATVKIHCKKHALSMEMQIIKAKKKGKEKCRGGLFSFSIY